LLMVCFPGAYPENRQTPQQKFWRPIGLPG
jgi:hypothetical protein